MLYFGTTNIRNLQFFTLAKLNESYSSERVLNMTALGAISLLSRLQTRITHTLNFGASLCDSRISNFSCILFLSKYSIPRPNFFQSGSTYSFTFRPFCFQFTTTCRTPQYSREYISRLKRQFHLNQRLLVNQKL